MENNLQNHIISYLIANSPRIQNILRETERINEYAFNLNSNLDKINNNLDEIKDIIACSAILSNNNMMTDDINAYSHNGRLKARRILLSIVNSAYEKYVPGNIS